MYEFKIKGMNIFAKLFSVDRKWKINVQEFLKINTIKAADGIPMEKLVVYQEIG
jgi:hypothetical protein